MTTRTQFANRILSLVLALVMVLGMVPTISFTASAAEPEYDGVIGELYYKVDKENNVTTIFGNGALGSTTALANVMTSNVIIEEGVTSISNYAFRGLSSLEKLTVKGDVTIGNYAFQGCASLETITFMGNVTSVGRNAFYGCASLTNINYYGTTEPSYTNALSYITLYSSNGVPFCGLSPMATDVSYAASVTAAGEGGVTRNYTNLLDAIAAAQETEGATLKLLGDVDTNVVIDGGTFTFDLNGHKIEAETTYDSIVLTKASALTVEEGADITLTGSGSIISNGPLENHTSMYHCIRNKGKLRIDGDITIKTNEYRYNIGVYNYKGQLTIDNCSVDARNYAIDSYGGTVTINGGSFRAVGAGLSVSGNASVTIKGGSFIEGDLDFLVTAPATVKLGAGDDGLGPAFPGGILVSNTVILGDLLEENCYFAQNGSPVDMTDISNEITGDVSVAHCDHSKNTNTVPTADDASTHSLFCSDCGARISQNNHSLDGGICTGCGYGCSHSTCITENNVTKCAKCPVVLVAQVGDAYFAKLSDAVAAANGTKGSTLTLLADVKGDFVVTARSAFTLDLNGKTLRGTSHGSIITVEVTAELTIKSSVSGGKITGCSNQNISGPIYVYGTLKLESGEITGNSAKEGGGVYVGGTFVMNGGKITGNSALYNGGGVYVVGAASFTMNGGSITNNTVTVDGTNMRDEELFGGGGVYVFEGTFTMNGGSISGNNATHTKGGGVMVSSYLSKCGNFVMNGGSITGNAAGKKGGGVYLMGPGENQTVGSFTVNGNSVISGNTVKGEANNVYLETPLSIGSDLSTTASVGITASTTPTDAGLEIASSGATEKNKSAFVSDNINYAIVQKAGKLYLYPHIHSWVYTKDGEKITAACEASGCTAPDGGYVTIAAPSDLTYTGSKIEAVVDNKLTTGDTVAVEYTKDPIDVGSYTASITLDGKTISVTYRIDAASIRDANVVVGGTAYTYDGTAKEPTSITVTMGGKTLTKDTDYTVSYSDNVNAGTVTVTVTGKGNYKDSASAGFTIDKGNPNDNKLYDIQWPQEPVYDGTRKEVTITSNQKGMGKITVLYFDSQNADPDNPLDPVDARNYLVVMQVEEGENFYGIDRVAGYFSIAPAEGRIEIPAGQSVTYDGQAITAGISQADILYTYNGDSQVTVKWYEDNNGAKGGQISAPIHAGTYWIGVSAAEGNYTAVEEVTASITIAKADQTAPTGLTKTDTTYFGKADGKISGLTSAMEFRREGTSAYTAGFDGTLEYLAAGTYYIRYPGDADHNPSPDAVVTVNPGRKLTVTVPQNQVGYTVTANKTELEWEGSYSFTVTIHEGYTATEDFEIWIGQWNTGLAPNKEHKMSNAIADQVITVKGVADITPPSAEIKVNENQWTSFLNDLTFGLFFNKTQEVSVTVTDQGSGVKSIQYYLSHRELELDEVRAITSWIDYNGTFQIDPDDSFVVYVKVGDHDGNVAYINSEGIVLDATAPVISGVQNGKTYYTTQKVAVSDKNILSITLNGEAAGNEITLEGNKEAAYTVVATDKAGNSTTVTVTMKPIKELAKATENLGNDNVTSADAPALEELVEKLDELLADPDTSNDSERETLEQHKDIAESLLKTIEDAAKATDTDNTEKVKDVTAENVAPENKGDLEKAKADLEKALADNGGNYTEDEKKAVEDGIKRIDEALEVIGNVEAVEESISKLPAVDTVKPDDEETIKAITNAQTAYNALTDYEKSLVDEAAKASLDKLATALVDYEIVEGDGSSWTEDSDHNITFVVNGLFGKFVGIKVDGKDVDKANYEVKAGSTIITLKASYLDTLAVGEHTITVVYTDGSTDGTFNVHAKANSPATGDNSHMMLWIALLFISGGAVITLTAADRKKRSAAKR